MKPPDHGQSARWQRGKTGRTITHLDLLPGGKFGRHRRVLGGVFGPRPRLWPPPAARAFYHPGGPPGNPQA